MSDYPEKFLTDKYFHLLLEESLTKEKVEALFKGTVSIIQNDILMHDIEIQEAKREDAPIAQVGFIYDEKTCSIRHLITVNYQKMIDFPIPRILLVAAHECGHLFASEEKTNDLERGSITIDEYIEFIRRKDGDWYQQESELKADQFGFFRSKNIYQRAVHDASDDFLKQYFWDCYRQIEMNEMIEMEKHRVSLGENDERKTISTL